VFQKRRRGGFRESQLPAQINAFVALVANSQRTLCSTFLSIRIQRSNAAGMILYVLLKQQNTNPRSGRFAACRVGVYSAILRLLSLA
jgi:hypothetical protein